MALTRARVVSGVAGLRRARRGGHPRRAVPAARRGERSPATSSRCAARSRPEKGDGDRWDLKYVAGGLVDLEFIAQYLQLVHAAATPGNSRHRRPRACSTRRARLGVLATGGCRGAAPGGAALSGPHADPAALPDRAVRSEDGRRRVCSACWRAPPTCRISPRSKRISPRRRRAVRASFVRILGKAP